MRSRFVMATVVATALACLAATLHAQDQGQKGQRGQRGQGGQGGQPGGRGFGGGGGFGGFGAFGGGFGRTSRLQLLNVEAVQKELELVDEQLTAIAKVRDELQPMRGRGGPGAPGGDGGGRRRGGNGGNNPPNASLQSADLYFVQAQQPPAQGQGGQGRRGGGQGGAGGFGGFGQPLTPEQQAEADRQRAERNKLEKEKLAEILLPHQMKRLTEIYYQQLGTNIFTDPDAVAELKITDDQKKKATEVSTANREAITALMTELRGGGNAGNAGGRGNFTPFTEEQTAKLTDARKKNDEKLMAILTADQTKKLEELKGKPFTMPEGAFGRGGRGGGAPGGAPGGNRRGGNNNP